MSGRVRYRAGFAILVLSLVTSACGTTVSERHAPAGVAVDAGAPAAVTGIPGPDGMAVTGDSAPGPQSSSGSVGLRGVDQGVPGNSVSSPGATTAAGGRGSTATTIRIGLSYARNADAALAALGAGGVSTGDPRRQMEAVLADINARGGVGGRRLVPVWHPIDATSGESLETQYAAMCAAFTEDDRVFAALVSSQSDSFQQCLAKAGVLQLVASSLVSFDREYFRRYPHLVDVGTITQDRRMAELVRAVSRRGWFGGWNTVTGDASTGQRAKVGVLSWDMPTWERPLRSVLLPALRRLGHAPEDDNVLRVPMPESQSDASATVASIQSAILRFRNDGVTHVLFMDYGGWMLGFFGQGAQQQRYFPRYGIDSSSYAQVAVSAGLLSSAQLNGALGVGWLPTVDLDMRRSATYATGTTRRCLSVLGKARFTFDDSNALTIALRGCDQLYLLVDVLSRGGSPLTLAGAQAAVDRTGSGYTPALAPSSYLARDRHDGLQTGFDLAWDVACSCTTYLDKHVIP